MITVISRHQRRHLVACLATALMIAGVALAHAQSSIDTALARIYSEYTNALSRREVALLVSIDRELRTLIESRESVFAGSLRPEYEDLGVSRALFEPSLLVYSGKVLLDAHQISPRSRWRNHTLYSTVFVGGQDGGIPNVQAARAYLREFPTGPFAADVYLHLGHFRDDLYKVLVGLADPDGPPDYKLDCYRNYVTKQSYRVQQKAAQNAAIANYQQVLLLRPGDDQARLGLAEVSKGDGLHTWYFCPD